MKKPALHMLVAVTLVFGAFTLGLLLGRNSGGQVRLEVPASMQTRPPETQAPTASPTLPGVQFPIDLNAAGLEELTALPGIGQVLAKRILDYREQNGPFQAVEELLNVEDIGEKRLEEIIELVEIGG